MMGSEVKSNDEDGGKSSVLFVAFLSLWLDLGNLALIIIYKCKGIEIDAGDIQDFRKWGFRCSQAFWTNLLFIFVITGLEKKNDGLGFICMGIAGLAFVYNGLYSGWKIYSIGGGDDKARWARICAWITLAPAWPATHIEAAVSMDK